MPLRTIVLLSVVLLAAAVAGTTGDTLWKQQVSGNAVQAGVFGGSYAAVFQTADSYVLQVMNTSDGKLIGSTVLEPSSLSQVLGLTGDDKGAVCALGHHERWAELACIVPSSSGAPKIIIKQFTKCFTPVLTMTADSKAVVECNDFAVIVVGLPSGDTLLQHPAKSTSITAPGLIVSVVENSGAANTFSLESYDLTTMKQKWSVPVDSGYSVNCASDQLIVLAQGGVNLQGFDTATGKFLWNHTVEEHWVYSGTCESPTFFYSSVETVFGLDSATGKPVYNFSGSARNTIVSTSSNTLFQIQCQVVEGHVLTLTQALDLRTGVQKWKTSMPVASCSGAAYTTKTHAASGMPLNFIQNGSFLAVPNLIGVNVFDINTGDRVTSDGLAELQFGIIRGFTTAIASDIQGSKISALFLARATSQTESEVLALQL